MELRKISGENFIVQRDGKREIIQTPAEFVAAQNGLIAKRDAAVGACRIDAAGIQARIESALLNGEPTASLRAELVAIREQGDAFADDIREAHENIRSMFRLIDSQEAAQIKQADAARLSALTAPYDQILKELA